MLQALDGALRVNISAVLSKTSQSSSGADGSQTSLNQWFELGQQL